MCAKLSRASQTLFGATGATSNFGQFGSLAASAPTTTKTPSVIQGLAAWLAGWQAATIGTLIPAYQDMNSVHYLAFYQICYILQMGIPEYDSGTTYYTNSVAQENGQVYVSLIDNNTGNDPASNPTDWQAGLPGAESTGVIKQYAGIVAPNGYFICDGSAVSRSTYANLFSIISTIYGIGDGTTTFNIPDLRTRVSIGYTSGDANFGTLGNTGGQINETISIANFPNSSLTGTALYGNGSGDVGVQGTNNGANPGSFSVPLGGSATPLPILQPYIVLNSIIKF